MEYVLLLRAEVNRLNESTYDDHHSNTRSRFTNSNDNNAPQELSYGRITLDQEFNFFLTKHWNLYSAMIHSPFLVKAFPVWNEKGRIKLETFLAKMGIPLHETRQPYLFMNPTLKKRLRHQLEKWGSQEGLDDPLIEAFTRKLGYKLKLSSIDHVHVLRAILSSCVSLDFVNNGTEIDKKDWKLVAKKNFHVAFDALDRYIHFYYIVY